jgi:hypothetical protein
MPDPPPPPPPQFDDLPKLAARSVGDNFASHFATPLGDDETEAFLQKQSRRFTSGGQQFSCSLLSPWIIDFGGLNFNENTFIGPVDAEKNDGFFEALSRRLGSDVTPVNTAAVYVVNRFADPAASRRLGITALRYTDYIIVVQLDLERDSALVHRLSPSGLSTVSTATLAERDVVAKLRENLNGLFSNGPILYKGPPNRLAGWDEKSKEWGSAKIRHAGFAETTISARPVQYQLVHLEDFDRKEFDARLLRSLAQGIEHDYSPTPIGLNVHGIGANGIVITEPDRTPPPPSTGGSSAGGQGLLWFSSCPTLESHDACINCCNTAQAGMVTAGLGVGLALAKEAVVCGPWAWACVVGAAVLTAGAYIAGDILARDCRAACEKTHAAGGGGHTPAGTGGHTHLR